MMPRPRTPALPLVGGAVLFISLTLLSGVARRASAQSTTTYTYTHSNVGEPFDLKLSPLARGYGPEGRSVLYKALGDFSGAFVDSWLRELQAAGGTGISLSFRGFRLPDCVGAGCDAFPSLELFPSGDGGFLQEVSYEITVTVTGVGNLQFDDWSAPAFAGNALLPFLRARDATGIFEGVTRVSYEPASGSPYTRSNSAFVTPSRNLNLVLGPLDRPITRYQADRAVRALDNFLESVIFPSLLSQSNNRDIIFYSFGSPFLGGGYFEYGQYSVNTGELVDSYADQGMRSVVTRFKYTFDSVFWIRRGADVEATVAAALHNYSIDRFLLGSGGALFLTYLERELAPDRGYWLDLGLAAAQEKFDPPSPTAPPITARPTAAPIPSPTAAPTTVRSTTTYRYFGAGEPFNLKLAPLTGGYGTAGRSVLSQALSDFTGAFVDTWLRELRAAGGTVISFRFEGFSLPDCIGAACGRFPSMGLFPGGEDRAFLQEVSYDITATVTGVSSFEFDDWSRPAFADDALLPFLKARDANGIFESTTSVSYDAASESQYVRPNSFMTPSTNLNLVLGSLDQPLTISQADRVLRALDNFLESEVFPSLLSQNSNRDVVFYSFGSPFLGGGYVQYGQYTRGTGELIDSYVDRASSSVVTRFEYTFKPVFWIRKGLDIGPTVAGALLNYSINRFLNGDGGALFMPYLERELETDQDYWPYLKFAAARDKFDPPSPTPAPVVARSTTTYRYFDVGEPFNLKLAPLTGGYGANGRSVLSQALSDFTGAFVDTWLKELQAAGGTDISFSFEGFRLPDCTGAVCGEFPSMGLSPSGDGGFLQEISYDITATVTGVGALKFDDWSAPAFEANALLPFLKARDATGIFESITSVSYELASANSEYMPPNSGFVTPTRNLNLALGSLDRPLTVDQANRAVQALDKFLESEVFPSLLSQNSNRDVIFYSFGSPFLGGGYAQLGQYTRGTGELTGSYVDRASSSVVTRFEYTFKPVFWIRKGLDIGPTVAGALEDYSIDRFLDGGGGALFISYLERELETNRDYWPYLNFAAARASFDPPATTAAPPPPTDGQDAFGEAVSDMTGANPGANTGGSCPPTPPAFTDGGLGGTCNGAGESCAYVESDGAPPCPVGRQFNCRCFAANAPYVCGCRTSELAPIGPSPSAPAVGTPVEVPVVSPAQLPIERAQPPPASLPTEPPDAVAQDNESGESTAQSWRDAYPPYDSNADGLLPLPPDIGVSKVAVVSSITASGVIASFVVGLLIII